MARLVITAVVVEGRSQSEVARDYGVSRQWVNVLIGRYRRDGEAAFEPRSRRPHSSPNQTPDCVEDEIVEIHKELDGAGHDAGAATIAFHLEQRHGLTVEECPMAAGNRHLRYKEILNQIDDHSRLCIGSDAATVMNGAAVDNALNKSTGSYGFPAIYLTDNGAVFNGKPRGGGMTSFERFLLANRVRLRHSTPYHPQTCGKVERFHQTLKKWLTNQPPARTTAQLQTQLDTFRNYYNDIRPHRALGRRTPATAYTARPKATPTAAALTVGTHHRVRRDKINKAGNVTLRHNSRLHHIGIGRRHVGTYVLLLVRELHVRVITEDGELLRELTLDPSRDYQPQA